MMFQYREGFEIDGSDTEYNLAVPEREKCFEILDFYLSLKTIDKRFPFELIQNKKRSFHTYDERAKMLEALWSERSFTLRYHNINPDQAYPEVRREMLDLLAAYHGIDLSKLHCPVISDATAPGDDIYVAADITQNSHTWEVHSNASTEKYVSSVLRSRFYFIEFSCSLGGPLPVYLYNLRKLAERFPELEIDRKATADYIDYCLCGKIMERVETEVHDVRAFLAGLVLSDNAFFNVRHYHPYSTRLSKEHLTLAEYFDGKTDESKYFAFEGFADGNEGFVPEPYHEIISGIRPDAELTIAGYADYLDKLETVSFGEIDFTRLSKFDLHIEKNNSMIYCSVRFIRKGKRLCMQLDIPFQEYDYVRKLLLL